MVSPRRQGLRQLLALCLPVPAAAALLGVTGGCTPTHHWRLVRDEDNRWQAYFPGKPVKVQRRLPLTIDSLPQLIDLTLWAVKINEVRFTVGLAQPLLNQSPVQPLDDPKVSLKALARALELALLKNIHGQRIESHSRLINGFWAQGQIQLQPNTEALQARLLMTTLLGPSWVLEALVIGPFEAFQDEIAEQFLDSVRLS